MSSNLKVNSLVPATGTEIGIGTTGGSIDFRCPATFGGNVTIGGTLTYDEVINIDSIGIVTARSGLNVQAGQLDVGSNIKLGNAGIVTASGLDISGDMDIDGHTNLDNVSIAGITTFSDNVNISSNKKLTFNNPGLEIYHNNSNAYLDNNVGHFYIRNDVDGDTNSNIYIQAKSGENGVSVGNDGSVVLFYNNNSKLQTTNTGTYTTGIGTFTDKISVTGSQNSMLTNNQLIFDRAGTSYIDNSNNSGSLSFRIGSSYAVGLFIDSSANVSIPSKLMHHGDTDTYLNFGTNQINLHAGGTTGITVFDTNVRIPTKLGINGATPQSPLDVIANSSGYAVDIRGRSTDDTSEIHFCGNNSSPNYAMVGVTTTGGGQLNLSVAGSQRLNVNASGHLTLQGGKIYGEDNASNSLHIQSTSGNNNHSRIEIGTIQSSDNGGIHFYTAGSSTATRRLTIKGTTGNVGINHDDPNTQLIVRAPGGSGHASAQVHSGDSSTILNMMVVQGSEGRFGMNTNHDLAIYANGLEKVNLSKTGSLFIKSLDTVPVNQAESGHYASTGYNAGHTLGLMVKRSICVSDADTKGVGGIFLSHTRNVTCDGTTYNMMTLHNREGTFVGDVYVGFSAGGSGVVRHYKFTCLYAVNTLTSVDYHSRLNTDTISVNISTSNDAHFFQVIPNHANNETHRVSMTIVGAACGRHDGAGGDYYTVNYN